MSIMPGWKTYIIGFITIIVAGLYHLNYIDIGTYQMLLGLLTGSGLMALRAGVEKINKK